MTVKEKSCSAFEKETHYSLIICFILFQHCTYSVAQLLMNS